MAPGPARHVRPFANRGARRGLHGPGLGRAVCRQHQAVRCSIARAPPDCARAARRNRCPPCAPAAACRPMAGPAPRCPGTASGFWTACRARWAPGSPPSCVRAGAGWGRCRACACRRRRPRAAAAHKATTASPRPAPGPSGAGKSTLLNALACRLDPTSALQGQVRLNGAPYDRAVLKRCARYVAAGWTLQRTQRRCRQVVSAEVRVAPIFQLDVTRSFPTFHVPAALQASWCTTR